MKTLLLGISLASIAFGTNIAFALAQSYSVGQTVSAANNPTYVYPNDSGSANPWIGNDAYGNRATSLRQRSPAAPAQFGFIRSHSTTI